MQRKLASSPKFFRLHFAILPDQYFTFSLGLARFFPHPPRQLHYKSLEHFITSVAERNHSVSQIVQVLDLRSGRSLLGSIHYRTISNENGDESTVHS